MSILKFLFIDKTVLTENEQVCTYVGVYWRLKSNVISEVSPGRTKQLTPLAGCNYFVNALDVLAFSSLPFHLGMSPLQHPFHPVNHKEQRTAIDLLDFLFFQASKNVVKIQPGRAKETFI